ncbi:putative nucleoredoxin 1-2 [Platanthera guangdongensis]|uniref:protein-disulfide reductase n=1 Tax=Platanthera guangdongensis TaxID=2320717 RepID=A0ABR2LQX6_9ASPA
MWPERRAEAHGLGRMRPSGRVLRDGAKSAHVDSPEALVVARSSRVPVSELVGKNILLYFSAHWCPPCRAFLPHLIEVYNNIKEKDGAFEIIFVSSDEDEESFDGYFSQMPWPSLPFWDERKRFLTRVFKISGIPSCVAINPEGKTVTKEARSLIMEHGANAYPFTKEQIKKLKDELEEKAKNWPEKIKHKGHNHALWKSRRAYMCDGCGKKGHDWSFHCKKCDFDLHPHCALDDDHEVWDSDDDDEDDEAAWPEKIKHMLHKHVLVKAWRSYQCDACGVVKHGYWSYFCEECDFDLHPECALGNQATVKVVDSDDESDVDNEDDDDVSDEDDGESDSDHDEDENQESEMERRRGAKDEDEQVDEDEDEDDGEDGHGDDDQEEDEDDDGDGPGMRGSAEHNLRFITALQAIPLAS